MSNDDLKAISREFSLLHFKIEELENKNESILRLLTDIINEGKVPEYFLNKISEENKNA